MTLPLTEVLIFDASDALRANPDLLAPAIVRLKEEGHNVPIYAGVDLRDPNGGFIFVHWNSFEHHEQVKKEPYYPDLTGALRLALAGPPKAVFHVQLSAPATPLDKPITAVVLVALKTPENRADFVDLLTKFPGANGASFVFGRVHEDENKYVLLSGWSTLEEYQETSAKPEVAAVFERLFSLADKESAYLVKLKTS